MPRISYVNGRYVRHALAGVHIEDRGYQFADGIYEVIGVAAGRLVDAAEHFARMEYSLRELSLSPPLGRGPLEIVIGEVLRRNRIGDGMVYLQITRGVAARNHAFPGAAESALVVTARAIPPPDPAALGQGVRVITIPDIRWKRCDIKSVSLLPNILGKQQAQEAGAYEAWMVNEDGVITEGTSSNAWIVNAQQQIVTRPASQSILAGITRKAVIALAAEADLALVERAFGLEEAYAATEAFLTSTTSFVKPVIRIDDQAIGTGKPGAVAQRLLAIYLDHIGAPRA